MAPPARLASATCPECRVVLTYFADEAPPPPKSTCPCCGEKLRRTTPADRKAMPEVVDTPTVYGHACKAVRDWCKVHRIPAPGEPCPGPGPGPGEPCGEKVIAKGLCSTHLKQQERGRPLTPIRRGPGGIRISTRVPPDVHKALGKAPGSKAREVLTSWARSKR